MATVPLTRRQRGTLVAAGVGFVVVLLDVSVVNVALETLRVAFGTDIAGLQWVVNAYTLVFAALLLTSGALGDRMGAKRVFVMGFGVFTMASLACGLAPSLALLVAARIVQGMGAALLVPSSLMLLQRAFPDPVQRSRAVGWWGAAGGIALAAGPVLGGLLIAHVGWRGIFLINLPIGALGLALTLRHAPTAVAKAGRGLDLPGQLAAILALASLTAALTEASRLGWTHPWICGGVALSLVSAAAFYWLEQHSKAPMLPLSLFRSATFSIATAVGLVVNFAYYGLVFVFSLFFQAVQQLSAQQTGLAFLPMTAILMVMNIVAGRLITRIGTRALMVTGLALASLGYVLLLRVSADGSYLTLVLPMLLAASGIALVVPTMTNATLSSVDAAHAGIASGVLNSARQIGGMLGVAVCGFFVRDTEPVAFLHGMRVSIALAVVLLSAGGVLSYLGLKKAFVCGHGGGNEQSMSASWQFQRENSSMETRNAMLENPTPLTTERLILRPWLDRDRTPFAAMSADPEVMAHLLPFASPEAADAWIDRQQAHLKAHGFCFWALESRETGEFIGAAGLLRVSYDAHFTPAVEVGWRLDRRFWGRGLAPEAARRAIDFGFGHLGLEEIVANTVAANTNSRRVMEKLGMTNDAADDFDHPLVPIGNPLRRQVLYRLRR